MFMIDEIGDLYYDSGNPELGLYAVGGAVHGGWGATLWVGRYPSLHSPTPAFQLAIGCAPGPGHFLPHTYHAPSFSPTRMPAQHAQQLLHAFSSLSPAPSPSSLHTLPTLPLLVCPLIFQMDTHGNLFNFYTDTDGSRKITPVGNVSDLKKFKISEIAGMKLDK